MPVSEPSRIYDDVQRSGDKDVENVIEHMKKYLLNEQNARENQSAERERERDHFTEPPLGF